MIKLKLITPAQRLLRTHLLELGIATTEEYRFCADRRWRFDLACPDIRLAFEISGGNWTGGHRRGVKQENEYDKLNRAQMEGWRVMQWTNRQVLTGGARAFMQRYISDGPSQGWEMLTLGQVESRSASCSTSKKRPRGTKKRSKEPMD